MLKPSSEDLLPWPSRLFRPPSAWLLFDLYDIQHASILPELKIDKTVSPLVADSERSARTAGVPCSDLEHRVPELHLPPPFLPDLGLGFYMCACFDFFLNILCACFGSFKIICSSVFTV